MNLPSLKHRSATTDGASAGAGDTVGLEDHYERSRQSQRRADKWMIVGAALMGMWAPG